MKKRLFSLAGMAFILIILLSPGSLSATPDNLQRPIRVGVYENAPKIFTDDNGKVSGLWADIMDYIAEQEGWDLQYVHGSWAEGLERLKNNEIDIMVDMALSEKRKKLYDFNNETVLVNWATIYARKDVKIESFFDLAGKKITAMEEGIHFSGPLGIRNLLNSFYIVAEFVPVKVYGDVFKVLNKGEADAGVVNRIFGISNVHKYPNIKPTNIVFNPVELRFALTKNSSLNPYLIERLDFHLKALKEDKDSVYYESIKKHFKGITEKVKIFPKWAKNILFIISVLLLLFLGTSIILKKQVEARTVELRNANEKLQKARDGLEEKVAERTKELAQANLRLKELDRLKSIFLASMSHELRTPLNSIIGFTGILLMGISGELSGEQKKQLTMVKNSADHLLSLINDILDISKIEAGKADISLEEFALDEVIREVIETLSPLAGEKSLEIIQEVPDSIMLISDRRRVKQVLMNLASNAVKFTDRGNVKITARVLKNEKVELSVADTGMGIKEEDISRLFHPFQQVDKTLTRKSDGTGLGLYLCRKLASLLGGDISVKSEYKKGSQFTFLFPQKHEGKKSNDE